MTGRSAVRLARVLREHEVGGSNPLAPIFYLLRIHQRTLRERRSGVWLVRWDRKGQRFKSFRSNYFYGTIER